MKRTSLTVMLGAALTLAISANAQYRINEADGIAASPKVRQVLNERQAAKALAQTPSYAVAVGSQAASQPDLAASPKVRQALTETRRMAPGRSDNSAAVTASVGYQPTGPDGITASPRIRQQINERSAAVIIAPVR